jgi:hypothetical protein
MDKDLIENIQSSVLRFVNWLDMYGETSYDHQSFFASDLGRRAKMLYYRRPKIGTLAVSPMIFCEAFLPSTRRLFWKPQRFAIADAHYAMGFAFLAATLGEEKYYRRAVHFLEVLIGTKSPDYYGWGIPFDWATIHGIIKEGTPFITTAPYAYEAFTQVYQLDKNEKWLQVMKSIAEHVYRDYRDFNTSPEAATCSYTPALGDLGGVINGSAYRAFLLTQAAFDLSEDAYRVLAGRNLNFVLESQNQDGSWYYSNDGKRDFVDHFHTCFVLKSLAKIERLTGCKRCSKAIELGIRYYVKNLFDERGLPRPFSRAPRLTVYRRELYDYAECINLCLLLKGYFRDLDLILTTVVQDLLARWQKPDGSFRSRQLLLGWDNVPMHRWAQSQLFRSFCFLASQSTSESEIAPSARANSLWRKPGM